MSAQGMPPQILALFAPRLPLEFLPSVCGKKKKPVYDGIASFVNFFETDTPPLVPKFETPKERKERKKKEKLLEHRKKQDELIAAYDPHAADCATKNPYATLFIGRLSYEVTEKKLKKEFECYGPIRRVKVVTDFNGKSRGYAFIEYETEEALKTAYKQGDGKKIDGRRVLVDVERSRTVPGWIPRRLGGGKGPARYAEPKKKGNRSSITTSTLASSDYYHSLGSSYRGSLQPNDLRGQGSSMIQHSREISSAQLRHLSRERRSRERRSRERRSRERRSRDRRSRDRRSRGRHSHRHPHSSYADGQHAHEYTNESRHSKRHHSSRHDYRIGRSRSKDRLRRSNSNHDEEKQ